MTKLYVAHIVLALFLGSSASAAPTPIEKAQKVASWLNPVDESSIHSTLEKRGFVTAPIDYSLPNGPKLQVAYRILPVLKIANNKSEYLPAESTLAKQKPLLLLINGGPGASSDHLRKPSFTYDSSLPKPTDRLSVLTQHFRIVLVDQRGTAGRSSSLNFDTSNIDPQMITDYFGPRSVALDHALVMKTIRQTDEPFYIIAQSYGGLVGLNYLVEMDRDRTLPRPKTMALTSPGLQSPDDAFQKQIDRRKRQFELAIELKKASPEVVTLLPKLRERIKALSPSSTIVDSMAISLGKPNWKVEFIEKVRVLLKMSDEELLAEIKGDYATIEPLNHILSSAIVTPGYTDRTLFSVIKKIVPLEDWMPDELRMYNEGRGVSAIQEDLLLRTDQAPPQAHNMATMAEARHAMIQPQVLFTASEDDALVPLESVRKAFQELGSGPNTRILEFKTGGHSAAFISPNCENVLRDGFGIEINP